MRPGLCVLLLSTVLALASCGSAETSSGSDEASTGNTSIKTNDLTAQVIGDASTFSLSAAVAQKPVAFWFWAPG